MGRMLAFMARIRNDNNITKGVITRGVGVDEHTALLLDVVTGNIIYDILLSPSTYFI
jgi:hypothetical protein